MKYVQLAAAAAGLLALAACGNSNVAAARDEMVEGCMRDPRTGQAYCECAADYVFDQLSADDAALLGRVSQLPQNLTDNEVAERLHMDEGELRRVLGRVQGEAGRHTFAAAQNCAHLMR